MGIVAWIIVGILAGALARAVVPGQGAGGWVADLGIGLCGSLVGGFLFRVFLGHNMHGFVGSTIVAFVGAVAFLSILRAVSR